MVDGDDLLRAKQHGAPDRHLSNRAAAPDRNRVGRLDVALDGGLPAGGENITQEKKLSRRSSARAL